jgi:hypothetical protein
MYVHATNGQIYTRRRCRAASPLQWREGQQASYGICWPGHKFMHATLWLFPLGRMFWQIGPNETFDCDRDSEETKLWSKFNRQLATWDRNSIRPGWKIPLDALTVGSVYRLGEIHYICQILVSIPLNPLVLLFSSTIDRKGDAPLGHYRRDLRMNSNTKWKDES